MFTNKLEKHRRKSRQSLDIFRKTLIDLVETNKEIQQDISEERRVADEAIARADSMQEIVNTNNNMHKKIKDFFEL